jgi:uncharacterized protein YjiS (DUF1127 family)
MEHASHLPPHCPPLARPGFAVKARLTHAVSWVERAFRTARERRQLMALDERALKDIGLSRADAHSEWTRRFWDLPCDR